ncbi:MAG: surA [Bacteroidetes bacterium]|jgi:peptidyl-prolyl cis-trans isomerase SurA|nr:surA [Bacteroidota bacterium]
MKRSSLLILLCVACAFASAQPLDRVVAIVDNEVILESELNAQIQFLALNNRIDPKTPGLKEEILQNMINEKLLVAKAIEDSITVSDEEVQQQLEAAIQQRIQQVGSEARLEELYGMPLSRIKREYRDEMRKNLLAQRLQQQRVGNATVGRFEVEEFYNTYKDSLPPVPDQLEMSRIFVTPKPSAKQKEEARAAMEHLVDSIKAGVDFGDLARRNSQDQGSAQQGGDLGFVRRGQFVSEFEAAVFSLGLGQVSNIIETAFGFHVVQLLERRGDAVHARHILLRIQRSENSDSSAIALLDSLRDRATKGESFAELAKKYSEDKESNLIGGLLPPVDLEQLEKDWSPSVTDLKDGEISKPFRVSSQAPSGTNYGYQIVLLRKRTPAHRMTLEQDYHKIEAMALNFKRQKDYQAWITELRSKIFWQINL